MKTSILICSLFLVSCSNLTRTENQLPGYWVWEIEINGYKEKGYLDLRHDRTYGTNYVSSNPAETLKFKHEYNEISYWREKNKKVCIASSWEAGNFIYNTTVKEEICLWDIVEGPAGRISLRFTAGFIQNGVFANKIGD